MSSDDKNYLLNKLDESHSAIQTILEGTNLALRVYSNSDWRVRDILGHIATWDLEVTKSLRAFLAGSEYAIPNMDGDETEFNEQAVAEQRMLSTQQIIAEWENARADFKAVLSEIPTERFPNDLLFPWGDERGSVALLVKYMIEHDEDHLDEIAKAVQESQEE